MLKPTTLYNSLLKYVTAAIILAVPLYPKFPFIRIPTTFVSIRLEDFLILFATILLIPLIIKDFRKLIKSDIVRAIVLYLSIGLVSLLSAILITKTVIPTLGILHWGRRIEYFIPLFLGYYAVKANKENFNFFFKLLLIVIVFVFLYGFGQKNFDWPVIITQNEEYSKGVALRYIPGAHINSSFAGHYDLATYLVLVLPVIVSSFFLVKQRLQKVLVILIWLCGLWLLVNSASRISLASYIGGISISLYLLRKIKYIPLVIIISILFINSSSNLLARYDRIFDVIKKNLSTQIAVHPALAQDLSLPQRIDRPTPTPTPIPVFEDRSTNIRLNVEWPRAIRALKKNPLLGTGYSSITLATDNDYLRALGETGLLGFLAFVLLGINLYKKFILNYPFSSAKGIQKAFVIGLMGGIPGILVNAVFIDVFEASKFAISFWLFVGMALLLIQDNSNEESL